VEAGLVEAIGHSRALDAEPELEANRPEAEPTARVETFMDGQLRADTPVYRRDQLAAGQRIDGPAILIEPNSTVVVEPGWRAALNRHGHLLLERAESKRALRADAQVDPVLLEVFNNLFRSIAEHMGATLQQTAWSANIKERLDFSCALFDAAGRLVANAPHVPVHLGSMGESVRAVIDALADDM